VGYNSVAIFIRLAVTVFEILAYLAGK